MQVLKEAFRGSSVDTAVVAKKALGSRKLIIASNRGPIEHRIDEGRIIAKRGSGGVVTALTAVAEHIGLTWIASAMTDGDRAVSRIEDSAREEMATFDSNIQVKYVVIQDDVYDKYYNVFSNPLLWFLQHQLLASFGKPCGESGIIKAWENGYVPVNRAFAKAVIRETKGEGLAPVVMFHDYHLYLAAKFVRERYPQAILQHFTHIPWPAPGYWQALPPHLRSSIVEGLCANDIVGFQTRRSLRNFLASCQAFLKGCDVNLSRGEVLHNGFVTKCRVYPISVDAQKVLKVSSSRKARAYIDKLRCLCGEHTIVRVDRLDPSKNIIRGYEALHRLLEQHPELIGRVKMLSFLVPCRQGIEAYQQYEAEVMAIVDDVNERFGNDDWRPIEVFHENNYEQALAGMQLYDVLLVNPVYDGMNLVAKEGVLVNQRDGVVVLSEKAGAYEELQQGVLGVDPIDVQETADALYQALQMSPQERKQRSALLRRIVMTRNIESWLQAQLEDLRAVTSTGLTTVNQRSAVLAGIDYRPA